MKKLSFAVLALLVSVTTDAVAAPSTPSAKPSLNDAQLGNSCANHLVKFEVVKTDCSVKIEKDGIAYCFSTKADQEEFEKDREINMAKARAFYEQVVKPGKYVPIPAEALTPRTPPAFDVPTSR